MSVGYTLLVGRAHCHSWGGEPEETCQKIHTSFLIPAVKSQALLDQGYTAPPAPRCLAWNVFLPDDLSYQDVWQQSFLLTLAYVQGLQYWAEEFNLPDSLDFCPLACNVLELRERVKEHVILSKQDVIRGLGQINPGNTTQWTQTSETVIENMEPSPAVNQVTCGIAPLSGDTTNLPTKLQLGGWLTDQDASSMRATTKSASVTTLVVELTCPIISSLGVKEERQCILVVTTSAKSLNSETTGVALGDTATTLVGGGIFGNPHMAAALSRPDQGRRVISNQDGTLKELGKEDANWETHDCL